MKPNPCGKCEQRFLGCHAQFVIYIEWRKMYEERNDIINKNRHENNIQNVINKKVGQR